MNVIKQKHFSYDLEQEYKKSHPDFRSHTGKYQHICTSEKGKISIVELLDYFMDGKNLWEIYCLEGNLFTDVERFDTLDDAIKQCEEYLK